MTDRPTRLYCRACRTPLAWFTTSRRDRLTLDGSTSAVIDVFSKRAVLTCRCGTQTAVTDCVVVVKVEKAWIVESEAASRAPP